MFTPFRKKSGEFTQSTSLLATRSGGENDKTLFFVAAGLSLTIVVVIIAILNFRAGHATATASANAPTEIDPSFSNESGRIKLIGLRAPVKSGDPITPSAVVEIKWDRASAPGDAVLSLADIQGQYAKVDLAPGLPLLRSQLTTEVNLNSLELTQGNRAVTISVDDLSTLEGHALPGTRVDVVLTYRTHEGELTSKILVQNARILAVGGDTTPNTRVPLAARIGRRSNSMTLDVATEDALKIQTAKQMGSISLLLRANDDNKTAGTVELSGSSIEGQAKPKGSGQPCNRGKMKMGGEDYLLGCDGGVLPAQ